MTPKYWIKVVLGMLGVFAVGMFIRYGVMQGKSKVEEIAEGTSSISIPMLGMGFRTSKGQLGSIQRLHVDRSAPKQVSGFRLAVTLKDGVDVDQFDNCEITVTNPEQIDENTVFTCVTAADAGFEELVQFGTIAFSPSGEVHRLMIPRTVRDEIVQSGRDVPADTAAGASQVTTDAGDGGLSVKVNGRQIVNIQGDSAGGTVLIIDPETGTTLVDIRGGQGGTAVKSDAPAAPPAPATGRP